MTIQDHIPEPHGSEFFIDEETYYYEGALEAVRAVVVWLNVNGHQDAANRIECEFVGGS